MVFCFVFKDILGVDSNSPSSYIKARADEHSESYLQIQQRSRGSNNLHRNIHTFSIPRTNRATLTYTATNLWLYPRFDSLPASPAHHKIEPGPFHLRQPLFLRHTTLGWHSPTQRHFTTTHNSGNLFQRLFCFPLLIMERPPRCISSLRRCPRGRSELWDVPFHGLSSSAAPTSPKRPSFPQKRRPKPQRGLVPMSPDMQVKPSKSSLQLIVANGTG